MLLEELFCVVRGDERYHAFYMRLLAIHLGNSPETAHGGAASRWLRRNMRAVREQLLGDKPAALFFIGFLVCKEAKESLFKQAQATAHQVQLAKITSRGKSIRTLLFECS